MNTPPTIALIDDDRTWLDTLADYLEGRGFPVQTAQGGDAGLTLLAEGTIALAVMDFRMPGLNGLEVLEQLRRCGRDVTVLLVSSEDDPTLAARAIQAGARAFLPKN